jgi:hypothetical protein
MFEPDGSHSNYGVLRGGDLLNEFVDKGLHLIRNRFALKAIEELPSRL